MAGSVVPTIIEHRSRGVLKITAVITCDASGVATETVINVGFGRLVAVAYKPGTFATGVDLTVKDYASQKAILVLTNAGTSARYFRPSAVVTDKNGTAVSAATSAPNVNRDIWLGGKVSVAAAQGGNLGAGELHLIVDETGVGAGSK